MAGRRRTEVEVAYAILSAIREEEQRMDGQPRKTRLQARVYLNWYTLNRHIDKLRAKGLVSREGLHLTQRGLQFISHYRSNLRPWLEEYGY